MKIVVSIFTALFLVFVVLTVFSQRLSSKTQLSTSVSTPYPVENLDSDKLYQLVNEWRTDNGYPVLEKDGKLCDIANLRVADIMSDYSHNGFNERTESLLNSQTKKSHIGENLSMGHNNENELLANWLNSKTHLENIEFPYTKTCVATSGFYAVQIFSDF